jgi:hypothetical protein
MTRDACQAGGSRQQSDVWSYEQKQHRRNWQQKTRPNGRFLAAIDSHTE